MSYIDSEENVDRRSSPLPDIVKEYDINAVLNTCEVKSIVESSDFKEGENMLNAANYSWNLDSILADELPSTSKSYNSNENGAGYSNSINDERTKPKELQQR